MQTRIENILEFTPWSVRPQRAILLSSKHTHTHTLAFANSQTNKHTHTHTHIHNCTQTRATRDNDDDHLYMTMTWGGLEGVPENQSTARRWASAQHRRRRHCSAPRPCWAHSRGPSGTRTLSSPFSVSPRWCPRAARTRVRQFCEPSRRRTWHWHGFPSRVYGETNDEIKLNAIIWNDYT